MTDTQLTAILLATFRADCTGLVFSDEWTEIDAFREWWQNLGETMENELGN